LSQNDVTHSGSLENISRVGALVRLNASVHLPKDANYELSVYPDDEEQALKFSAVLVNISFGMAGIKFTAFDSETANRLEDLLVKLSSDAVSTKTIEHDKYKRRFAENFREG